MDARAVLNRAMKEDELLIRVTGELTNAGWRWTHIRRSDRALTMGHPGFPDIVAAKDGYVLFIELKSEKGRVTKYQQAWREELSNYAISVDYYVVRPSTLNAFVEAIR